MLTVDPRILALVRYPCFAQFVSGLAHDRQPIFDSVVGSDVVRISAKRPFAWTAVIAVVVLSAVSLGVEGVRALGRPAEIVVGDVLDHQFDSPFLEDRGVGSLAELRGDPVLILNWGML